MNDDPHAMTREYVRALSITAWDRLRNSQYIQPPLIDERGMRCGRPKLLLWRDAGGFSDLEPLTLTVFQPFDDAALRLRKAVWKQSEDLRLLRHFLETRTLAARFESHPTVEVQDKRIDPFEFAALLDQSFDLRVPIVWPWLKDRDTLTTDVGMVGFKFFDLAEPQARISCAWSVDLPPDWQPVVDWFERMYEWLESQLNEK